MVNGRTRLTINFREKDKELYDYVIKKSEIVGASAFIKTLIKNAMEKEEEK